MIQIRLFMAALLNQRMQGRKSKNMQKLATLEIDPSPKSRNGQYLIFLLP
jgi:hypothetical protein